MTPDTWQRIKTIFAAARETPPGERSRFLDTACGGDGELRAEVDSLLAAADTGAGDPFDSPGTHSLSVLRTALADRYQIDRELGHGGMATVYLARDLKHDRLVALKVLRSQLARALGAERFEREIKLAARLQHPHILSVHDSGESAGQFWFTMPYVEGETLRQRLERDGRLPVAEALRVAIETARALDYAHAHGVIHRDIKPENLLLTRDGSTLVADFGIARVLGEGAERLTTTGVAIGTPAYMSPEQASGGASLDARTDVYSLGCVVYEMLAGETPYVGQTIQEVLAKHIHAPLPDLKVLRTSVPGTLLPVLEVALAKAPADRFGSAGEFARALELSASNIVAVGWRRRWRRPVRIVGTVAILVLIVALLVRNGAALRRIVGQSPPPTAAADAPRIAVLYFDDRTPDSSLRGFADGLTEELIHELSGVSAFRVISRNGVRPYRDRQLSFDSMVARLGATVVVDGSVQRTADNVLVRVGLIDARSDTYVDSMSVERSVTNLDTLRRELAQQVAAGVRRRMGHAVRLRGALPIGVRPQAWDLVLRARRARDDAERLADAPHPEDLRTANRALMRADSLLALAQVNDPSWLRPAIDRGWVAYEQARLLHGKERSSMLEAGLGFAEDAVRRAPQDAEALELRGTLQFGLVTDPDYARPDSERLHKAEADLRTVLDQDSTRAGAWATLSYLLQYEGATAEAVMAAQHALREDAYLTNAREVFLELFFSALELGDFGAAGDWCRRGYLSFPEDFNFSQCQLTLLRHDVHARPDPVRAWALVQQLDSLDPPGKAIAAGHPYTPIYRRMVAAAISARAGRPDIARAELARAMRATAGDSSLRLDLAADAAYLHIVLGERQQAEELLRRLVKARPALVPYLKRDPVFQPLGLDYLSP